MPAETKIGKTILRLVTGDIADQDTDAVVTAALNQYQCEDDRAYPLFAAALEQILAERPGDGPA